MSSATISEHNENNNIEIDEDSLKEAAAYILGHREASRVMKRYDASYNSKSDKIDYLSDTLKLLYELQHHNTLKNSKSSHLSFLQDNIIRALRFCLIFLFQYIIVVKYYMSYSFNVLVYSPSNTTNTNNNNNNNEQPGEAPFQFFRGRLVVRIFFGYLLFARNSSTARCTIFVIASIFYYLFEIGLIEKWFKSYVQRRNERRGLTRDSQAAQPDVNNGNNPNPTINPNPNVNNPQNRDFIDYIHHLSQSGIRIPVGGGVLVDIFSLVVAFVCSLFPTWDPAPEQN